MPAIDRDLAWCSRILAMSEGGGRTNGLNLLRSVMLTNSARVQRLHVEYVDSIHLSEDFQALKTSSLFEISGYSSGSCTRRQKILFTMDFCFKTFFFQQDAITVAL